MEQVELSYLKAKRSGISQSSESAQDFQKTLQGLSTELAQFDFIPGDSAPQAQSPQPPPRFSQQVAPPPIPVSTSTTHYSAPPIASLPSPLKLDPRSRQLIDGRRGVTMAPEDLQRRVDHGRLIVLRLSTHGHTSLDKLER